MNPVVTYEDLLDFLRWSGENKSRLLPVLILKPSTLMYLNTTQHLEHMFEYYDRRTGKDIQFFLPGYAHYPDQAFSKNTFSHFSYSTNSVAFSLKRLGNVYYSEEEFVNFINLLEDRSPDFHYIGDTELLFIQYIANDDYVRGTLDFSNIYRFNLSHIFYTNEKQYLAIDHFLEMIMEIIRNAESAEELLQRIKHLSEKQ